jgi:hypothetical protein
MIDDGIKSDLEIRRDMLKTIVANFKYPAGPQFSPTAEEIVNSIEYFIEEKIRVALGQPKIAAFGDK